MLPYISTSFEYPAGTKAADRLRQTLASEKWNRVTIELQDSSVTIEHKLPVFFRNSWNPIFQGRIESSGNRQRLVGYFRVNWFVLAFVVFFVGASLYRLLHTYFSSDIATGYVSNWRSERLAFDIQFFAMAIGINLIGWAVGIPYQRRILAAINESMCA
jgi:hypothetical protein